MPNAPGFVDQKPIQFIFCDYPLEVPSGHVLRGFFDPQSRLYQPYREIGLVKVIQSLQRQNRRGTVIDIGANVGDTCAIIHRHSTMKILSVEASDFFFPYLTANIDRLFKERAVPRHAFVIAAKDELPKGLYHWGGTAKAIDAPFSESCGVISITDLLASAGEIALLKIDIDGPDVGLISALLETTAPEFPIFFEYDWASDKIETIQADCVKLLALFKMSIAAGYVSAFLWDDPGRFFGLIDLHNQLAVLNAINYMGHFRHRSVWGYDICLVHESDIVFASELSKLISRDTVMPLNLKWSV